MQKGTSSWIVQAMGNRLVAIVLIMVAVIPLIASPANAIAGGVSATVYEVFGAMLLFTLLWRSRWTVTRKSVTAFLSTGANLPVLIFTGLAISSLIVSPHKAYSLQEALRLVCGVMLYFVTAYHFSRSEYLQKLLDMLIFVGITASMVGFAQFGMAEEHSAVSLFGDHQVFGSFLMILMPVLAAASLTEVSLNRKLLAQVATILVFTALLLALSRSAWIGAGCGVLSLSCLAFVGARQRSSLTDTRHEWGSALMLLIVASGFFLMISPQTESIFNRFSSLSRLGTDSTWQGRQPAWQGAIKMIKNKPMTGYGIGLYPYFQHTFTGLGRSLDTENGAPSFSETAHNLYLQTAAEMGIPGALLLITIVGSFLFCGGMRLRLIEPGLRRSLLIGSMGSIVAYAVDGLSSPSWQLGNTVMFFWLILGLGTSCFRPLPKRHEEMPAALHTPMMLRPAAAMGALVLLTAIPFAYAVAPLGGYISLDHVNITPLIAKIPGGSPQAYVMTATYHNSSGPDTNANVTLDPSTVFKATIATPATAMQSGPNGSVIQTAFRKSASATITGQYTFENVTMTSETSVLTARP